MHHIKQSTVFDKNWMHVIAGGRRTNACNSNPEPTTSRASAAREPKLRRAEIGITKKGMSHNRDVQTYMG